MLDWYMQADMTEEYILLHMKKISFVNFLLSYLYIKSIVLYAEAQLFVLYFRPDKLSH